MIIQEEPRRPMIGLVFGVLLTFAATGAGLWYLHRDSASHTPPPVAGDDVKLVQMIDENEAIDAQKWLDEYEGRMLIGMTRSQASHMIDHLRDMGAKQVLAFGGQVAMVLVVELPDDAPHRKMMFDWHRQWDGSPLAPPTTDVGQRYLLVQLKI
jgi:hypothetical protein